MSQTSKKQEGLTSVGSGYVVPQIFHIDCGESDDSFAVLALDTKAGATITTYYIWVDHTDGKLVMSTTQPAAHADTHTDISA